ncbi:unnamed protein product [Didymodactylos carnosus]|uniref:Uncharacterized protein n=1 Tax=Didymodactylos carnosus TaxID=1234261 RepID=A0A813S442_9BILA|nr:unnamed protein product [Didymodactylos carnosus]CAF3575163.1 unnamed protein product [Didymodactylos carnosus]
MKEGPADMSNDKKNNDEEEESSSSDDDSESSNTSSSDSSDSSDEDGSDSEKKKNQPEDKPSSEIVTTKEDEDDSDTNETTRLTPKQEYLKLKEKRTNLFKRALQLRDELKALPSTDMEAKKRLLKEIKNMRERCLVVQTRITNIKARLSHSPTPERPIATATTVPEQIVSKELINEEKRITSALTQPFSSQHSSGTQHRKPAHHHVHPSRRPQHRQRPKTPVSSSPSSRSRSHSTSPSRERSTSEKANTSIKSKPYRDLDEPGDDINFDDFDQFGVGGIQTSALRSRGLKAAAKPSQQRSTTSYLDLTDNSPSNIRSPTHSSSNLSRLSLRDRAIIDSSVPHERDPTTLIKQTASTNHESFNEQRTSTNSFANIKFPYPVINDNRDLDRINRILKDRLRQLEQKCNHLLFEQTNSANSNEQENIQQQIKRLQKQIEYVNGRIKIEKLKRTKCKTQREKEQAKKKMQFLIKDVHKLHSFMKTENRNFLKENSTTSHNNSFEHTQHFEEENNDIDVENEEVEEEQLSPKDLLRVTGKKTIFNSDSEGETDSEDKQKHQDEVMQQPQVPVWPSQSDTRTVPNTQVSDPDFAQLQPPLVTPSSFGRFDFSVPPPPMGTPMPSTLNTIKSRVTDLLNAGPTTKMQIDNKKTTNTGATTMNTRTNRKRRKKKKHNKKTNSADTTAATKDSVLDRNDDLKRQIAMQLQQSFLNNSLMESNPILKALTFEAQKKLGININANDKTEGMQNLNVETEQMDYDDGNINPSSSSTIPSMFPFNMLNFPPTNNNPLMNRYPSNNQSSSTPPNLADILLTLNGNSNLSAQQQQSSNMAFFQKLFDGAQPAQQTTPLIAPISKSISSFFEQFTTQSPTIPPTLSSTSPEKNLIQARKILNSLTHNDINELLKLSGDEHDDDYDSDDNNLSIDGGDMNNFTRGLSEEDDSWIDIENWMANENKIKQEQQQQARSQDETIKNIEKQHNKIQTLKNTTLTLTLPSLNRFTHLGKPTRRIERTFPSFSTQKKQTENNVSFISPIVPTSSVSLSMILYGC